MDEDIFIYVFLRRKFDMTVFYSSSNASLLRLHIFYSYAKDVGYLM